MRSFQPGGAQLEVSTPPKKPTHTRWLFTCFNYFLLFSAAVTDVTSEETNSR